MPSVNLGIRCLSCSVGPANTALLKNVFRNNCQIDMRQMISRSSQCGHDPSYLLIGFVKYKYR